MFSAMEFYEAYPFLVYKTELMVEATRGQEHIFKDSPFQHQVEGEVYATPQDLENTIYCLFTLLNERTDYTRRLPNESRWEWSQMVMGRTSEVLYTIQVLYTALVEYERGNRPKRDHVDLREPMINPQLN